jgi:hypothetical protein
MGLSILLGSGVFALGVVVQLLAIVALLRFLERRNRLDLLWGSLWTSAGAISGAMLIVFVGHLIQVGLWAGLFQWLGEFDIFETAFYHSAVNFSSLGYGDMVMSTRWRLLGPIEAASGILMFGISTGVGFAVVNALIQSAQKETNKNRATE